MKILIADPYPEAQAALHLVIGRIPEVTSVCKVGTLLQLLAQCAQSCPDLILFDLDLVPPTRAATKSLADLIKVLHRLCACSRVMVMGNYFAVEQEILAAGASGFISKTDPPEEVLSEIVRLLKTVYPHCL